MARREFPQYLDGDVEIRLSSDPKDTYLLHKDNLKLHSPWFEASVSVRWNQDGVAGASSEGRSTGSLFDDNDGGRQRKRSKIHYVYELRFEKWTAEGVHKTTALPGIPPCQDRLDVIKAHKDLFGALYHVKPTLSYESFEKAQNSTSALAKVAKVYSCEHVVHPHIESHLGMHWRENALECCARTPVRMSEFALVIESPWIFMVAATHLLGSDGATFDAAKEKLGELGIDDLMNRKRAVMMQKLRDCGYQLFCRIQPPCPGDGYCQLALDYVTQFLRGRLAIGHGSQLGEGYTSVNNELSHCGRGSVVNMPDIWSFVSRMVPEPSTGPSANATAPHVAPVFAHAAQILQPVLYIAIRGNADPAGGGLLFMTVRDNELPWAAKAR